MVNMASKEHFGQAVSAQSNEIDRLWDFRINRTVGARNFSKIPQTELPEGRKKRSQHTAFHFLRTDFSLLLGPSGTKLLSRTWCKYNLKPTETEPSRMRPALVRLFSVAARIAATKGVGNALQRLVTDFERLYFPIVVDPEAERAKKAARRFALLTVLQEGQGSHLLNRVLGGSETADKETFPSRLVRAQPNQARRLFLFEAAYRARSWSEAYRQSRLGGNQNSIPRSKMDEVRAEVFHQKNCPTSKKKQVLIELAGCSDTCPDQRLEYARKANYFPAPVCRPGQLEEILCAVTKPGDPWWRTSLTRLYRQRAVPHRWMSDLRKLWQTEPSLRNVCKVLFCLIRHSKPRALASLEKYDLNKPGRRLDNRQIKATVHRVRSSILPWLELAPPVPPSRNSAGAVIRISSNLWSFITQTCGKLEMEAPIFCRVNFQSEPALVRGDHSKRFFSFSPEFLTTPSQEQRVLLARALFREATGLERLTPRVVTLHQPQDAMQRALDYAEWCGHPYELLAENLNDELSAELAVTCLEEMYWDTSDKRYQQLAALVHRGCWSPLFEREADTFACSGADLVTSSHALLQADIGAGDLGSACQIQGLSALGCTKNVPPSLCLRLQSLWMTRIEEIQSAR